MAIAGRKSNGGSQCDYWGGHTTGSQNQPTAIFILWDDWGGWWDHVNPESAPNLPVLLNIPNCSAWGCGYAYGFRVPLLVVSAFTPSGYVSGDTRTQHELAPYIHDFGSLLGFAEYNFLGVGGIGAINPQYQFADAFSPERRTNPPTIPLADFFPQPQNQPLPFQQISVPNGMDANHFINYTGPLGDPDNDAVDND